jgi:dTDP-4-amino-4,6-dideoxygalactose transaminase
MADLLSFVDLEAQRARLGRTVDDAIRRVLDHGMYIMGPEVGQLERRLADRVGVSDVVTCSSGTDALLLPLLAWGIGPGDAVFVPAFTFAATAEVVALIGATPVFVDVMADTFVVDPESFRKAAESVACNSALRPAAVIPVDLFGLPADPGPVAEIAAVYGVRILCDAAQSFGAYVGGQPVGQFGEATATSFFPAKPFGCYGDGGAVFTNDSELAGLLRSLRLHGQGSERYDNARIGINGRLDTIQAAVLLAKLAIFDEELTARQEVAERYTQGLAAVAAVPSVPFGRTSAWAQYTLQVDARDEVLLRMREAKVPTRVYYPRPLHQQTAYDAFPISPSGLRTSERLSRSVLSLPMHPYLSVAAQDTIITALWAAVDR